MTLDDRSLREHLDRRASAGATDPWQVADAVVMRVAEIERGPWWRRLGVRTPALGLAAAAVVVVLIAVGVLPPRLGQTPGSSPNESTAVAPDYPDERALTAEELDVLLGPNPEGLATVVVIADVELLAIRGRCTSTDCPTYWIEAGGRQLFVYVPSGGGPFIPGPQAFRVRNDGMLDLVRPVRSGPDGLAWTLPQLTAGLPDLRAADRAVPYLYLVDAVRTVSAAAIPCPFPGSPLPEPDFSCGSGIAWLVPDEATVPPDDGTVPPNGLRVPNVTSFRLRSDALRQRGFWLVDPLAPQDICFLCPSAGAADLIGRVLTADELAYTPSETPYASTSPATGEPTPGTTPAAAAMAVHEIAFSTESVTLDGFETADVNVTATFAGDVVQYHQGDGSLTPLICLQRDGTADAIDPHPSVLSRTLVQIGETNPWVASFRLTSGDQGTWRVTCVVAYDADGQELNINPSITDASPKLQVIGTHAPHLTMELKPSPAEVGQALEVFGRVTDEDTGDPYAGVIVTIGRDTACTEGGTGETVTTDAEGRYTYVIPQADASAVCTWITDLDGVFPGLITDPVAIYATLFAHPTEP